MGRGLRDDAAGLVLRRRGVVVVELPRRARRRGVEQVVDVPDQRDRRRRRRVRARRLLCTKLRRFATAGAETFLACLDRYSNDARWRIFNVRAWARPFARFEPLIFPRRNVESAWNCDGRNVSKQGSSNRNWP